MNEPFSVESDSNYSLHLYTEVKNCKSLRAQIHSSSLNYCFVEAKHVLDIVLVHVAASKALYSLSYNELVTKNVYSEMLYSLSTVKDIGASLKFFGIQDHSTDVLVIATGKSREEVEKELDPIIEGKRVGLDQLESFTNQQEILQFYKLKGITNDTPKSEIVNYIVTLLASKNT